MRVWTGNGYGAKKLSSPMRVSADREVALPNDQPIVEGKRTDSNGVDVQVTFTQEITSEDARLTEGTVYRKDVAFVGSPKLEA
jgi:hypothetical protein